MIWVFPTLYMPFNHFPAARQKIVQRKSSNPQIMTKIRFELAPKPTKAEKVLQGKTGIVVVATR
jgi:hypothetical protein